MWGGKCAEERALGGKRVVRRRDVAINTKFVRHATLEH